MSVVGIIPADGILIFNLLANFPVRIFSSKYFGPSKVIVAYRLRRLSVVAAGGESLVATKNPAFGYAPRGVRAGGSRLTQSTYSSVVGLWTTFGRK